MLKVSVSVAFVVAILGTGCATYKLTPEPVQSSRKGFFDQKLISAHSNSKDRSQKPTNDSRSHTAWKDKHKELGLHQDRESRVGLNENRSDHARVIEKGYLLRKKSLSSSGFQWPVDSVSVTSEFGKRGKSVHEGIDLSAPIGTPVYASKSGVVLYSGSRIRGYGRLIVIRHAKEIATLYAHNSELLVHRGQTVKQGQQIAVSGNTGHVSGPHVHFEIRRGMAALNPMKFLPQPPGRLTASK